ncbi:MAG: LysM peptidoglycan-binding domain-containing protein [Planctomycetota bacterium]|nr:LysM peptidoglycan-binding domain-containing protein [Planctomycetota bacterium]
MSRELKLALVVGFCVVMVVAVLVSDHLSRASKAQLASGTEPVPAVIAANMPEKPLPGLQDYLPKNIPTAAEREVVSVPSEPEVTTSQPGPAAGAPGLVADNAPKPIETPDVIVPGKSTPAAPANSKPGTTIGQLPPGVTGAEQPAQGKPSEPNHVGPGNTLNPPSVVKETPKKTEPVTRASPVPGEKSHTIGEGDTLFKLCKKYYGDGMLWKQLATYNSGKLGKDGTLKTGAVLSIPPKEVLTGKPAPAAPVTAPSTKPTTDTKAVKPTTELAKKDEKKDDKLAAEKATKKAKVTTYTVKPGDTVGSIARKVLGTSKRAQEIINLNASDSFSEDELTPGMVIKVPAA